MKSSVGGRLRDTREVERPERRFGRRGQLVLVREELTNRGGECGNRYNDRHNQRNYQSSAGNRRIFGAMRNRRHLNELVAGIPLEARVAFLAH